MSKVSTIYDQLVDVTIPAVLPNHTRIPNAYSLEDNSDNFTRQGWGLRVGTSTPAESEFKAFNNERTFTIVLTREIIRLDSDSDTVDTAVKLLLEDVYELQKRLLNPDQIAIESDVEQIDISNVSGIEFVTGDKFNFAAIEADFLINIRENL